MAEVLSALALRQLAAWEHIARSFPVYTGKHGFMRCAWCDLTVWRLWDDKEQTYQYKDSEILALRVAHLRNHHPNLDPCEDIV